MRGLVLGVLGAWLVFGGCGRRYECDLNRPCEGFGETCIEGACVAGVCATSAQCAMESHCDDRQCKAGCAEPNDCYPGDTCDLALGECVSAACTNTGVDCGYREFCDQGSGDCYDAGENYCSFCNNDAECGGGNLCLSHYCGVDCSGGRECPSGFDCYAFGDNFGNVTAYQCFTYCWLYEGYEPGSFSMTPPAQAPDIQVSQDRAQAAGASAEAP